MRHAANYTNTKVTEDTEKERTRDSKTSERSYLRHLVERHGVDVRVEVVEIAEHEPAAVPHFPELFRRGLEHIGADADVGGVVAAGDPDPEQIGAVGRVLLLVVPAVDDVIRVHPVLERFGHLAALRTENRKGKWRREGGGGAPSISTAARDKGCHERARVCAM